MKFASFGLGDTSYPKFNWAHRKLYNRLLQLGAHSICDRGESDEQHPEGIDGSFLPWSTKLRQRLLDEYPLPEGLHPLPDHVLLTPKWVLDVADASHAQPPPPSHPVQLVGEATPVDELPPTGLLKIPGGTTACVTLNERITPQTHWQDVRHVKFDIAGNHPYSPGDILTIYPKNFPSDVSLLLSTLGWTSMADTPLHFVPSSPSTSPNATLPISALGKEDTITLRELLTNHLDIISIPRRSFFAQLAHYTSDEFHKNRLLEFTNPEYIDELYDYTTRPRRSILEVLQEFESVKIPWQRVCSIIPALRGRQFSIASAHNPQSTPQDQTRLELLIAIVKYKTVIKRLRQGVATRYIASLQPGQNLTVTLSKGGLGVSQDELDKPVVMIGPGTGVAPMRSLIYQRKLWREQVKLVSNGARDTSHMDSHVDDMLFFGCRNADSDYYFKKEWEGLRAAGTPLRVFAAFSRDQVRCPCLFSCCPKVSYHVLHAGPRLTPRQRQKIYVQDLVRQQSAKVHDALVNHNGIVYICGSSGKMPQAIREALIESFQGHGSMEREEAEKYLAALEKGGKYRQETW
ncbi:hypothetical protein NX059_000193 [Plenodomus lindquistii]|nr:hypothetical protein NX059_000193 [Plenodomus lindquistii]